MSEKYLPHKPHLRQVLSPHVLTTHCARYLLQLQQATLEFSGLTHKRFILSLGILQPQQAEQLVVQPLMGAAGAEKALITAASPFINGHLHRVGWNCLRLVWAPFLPQFSAFLVVLFKSKMQKLLSLLKG